MSSGPIGPAPSSHGENGRANGRLSYKFQRLREDIRRAVTQGEYTGRLPGERTLGRRFGANAKTINKALSDLTAEGLLIRQIGRGTFVASRDSAAQSDLRVTHVLADAPTELTAMSDVTSGLKNVERLASAPDEKGQWTLNAWPVGRRRDSKALVMWVSDPLSRPTPRMMPPLAAELHRRQVPVLMIGAASATERTNCVAPDYSDAGYRIAEHLLQCGCKAIIPVAIEQSSREIEAALAAIHAACVRFGVSYGGPVTPDHFATDVMMRVGAAANGRPALPPDNVGIICIGLTAYKAVQTRRNADLAGAGSMRLAAILAPGQSIAPSSGVTTYEWNPGHVAARVNEWAQSAKSALQPREVYVPGTLFPRHAVNRKPERVEEEAPRMSQPIPAASRPVEAIR